MENQEATSQKSAAIRSRDKKNFHFGFTASIIRE